MSITIPSAAQVRAALQSLTIKQMNALGELSGVPPTTIYKIKRGETDNPGIETVAKFMPFVEQVCAGQLPAEAQEQGADVALVAAVQTEPAQAESA
jgi:predicted transcriptional regulator